MGATVSRGELARLCGVTPAIIDRRIDQGLPCRWSTASSGRGRGKRQQPLFDSRYCYLISENTHR